MNTRTTTRLWVFADSFGVCDPNKDSQRVWSRQTAHRLSKAINQPIELFNYSLIGCAQDWTLNSYMSFVNQILPQDYVIIVLTSGRRYWFFEDQPTLTNWNIIDLDRQVGKERAKTVELYLKHVQRPELDQLQTVSRLALIAYQTKLMGLRNPLVIRAFEDEVFPCTEWPDLDWAQGTLVEIQWGEYQDPEWILAQYENNGSGYFKGYDCRYNHMCLDNHDLVSERIVDHFVKDTPVDLINGFHTKLIHTKWFDDREFMKNQLNPRAVEFYFENIHNQGVVLPWKRRVGIDIFTGKDN